MAWPTFTVDVTQNSNQIKVYGAVPASELPAGFEVIISGISNLEVSYGTAVMYDGSNNPYSHLYLVRPYAGATATNIEMVVKPTGSQFNDVVGIFQNGSNLLNSTMEGYRQFVEGTNPVTFQPLDKNAEPISIKPLQQMNQEAQGTIDSQTSEFNALMSSTTGRIDEALESAQNYANDTISAMGSSVESAIDTFMNGIGSSYYSDTQSGYVTKPEEFIETNTPNTIIDPNTAPIMVDGRLVEVTDQNIVLPNAPFAGDTSRTDTAGAVSKGDFIVVPDINFINGAFDSALGPEWVIGADSTAAINAGVLEITSTGGSREVYQALSTIIGATYRISFKSKASSGSSSRVRVGSTIGSPEFIDYVPTSGLTPITLDFTATGEITYLTVLPTADGTTITYLDDCSIDIINDTFQAIIDAPAATSLANTAYFQPIEDGISRQDIAVHRVNKSTLVYDKYTFKGTKKFSAEEMSLKTPVMDYYFGASDSNGLWSDATYWYVPIGAFTRFNAGAYEPFINPMGTSKRWYGTGGNAMPWYQSTLSGRSIQSTKECFSPTSFNVDSSVINDNNYSASIVGSSAAWLGRPDAAFYDKVYLNQTLDLRLKAYSESKQDLLNDVSQQIENGSYIGGVEGLVETLCYDPAFTSTGQGDYAQAIGYGGLPIQVMAYDTPYRALSYSSVLGKWVKVTAIWSDVGNVYLGGLAWNTVHQWPELGSGGFTGTYTGLIILKQSNNLFRNTMLHTDLISDPANYPQSLKDRLARGKSVVGLNPLLVGQDGTSYLDPSNKLVINSKKKIKQHLGLFYSSVWVQDALSNNLVSNSNSFGGGFTTYPIVISYTAKANSAIESQLGTTLSVLPKVFASNSHSIYKGGNAVYSAIGKVPVGNGVNGYEQKVLEDVNLLTYDFKSSDGVQTISVGSKVLIVENHLGGSGYLGVVGHVYQSLNRSGSLNLSGNEGYTYNVSWKDLGVYIGTPAHQTIALDNAVSPTSKRFYTLSELDNGLACLDMYNQEMISNVGVYNGDSAEFTQLSDGTLLDDNANTIITSVRSIPLNSFVGSK